MDGQIETVSSPATPLSILLYDKICVPDLYFGEYQAKASYSCYFGQIQLILYIAFAPDDLAVPGIPHIQKIF